MATANIITQYRPARIGLLVRAEELSDLEQAAGIFSLPWGGANNPIIPTEAAGENEPALRLVKLFRPDVLFELTQSPPLQVFSDRYKFLVAHLIAFHGNLSSARESRSEAYSRLNVILRMVF